MRGTDNSHAFCRAVPYGQGNGPCACGIHIGCWLVKQQHPWPQGQTRCQCNSLAFAARKLTWAAIRDHVAHQPASLVTELHDALAASSAEARRYWDSMTAINKSWYSDATDEQRAALNAERERSRSAERIIGARVRAVVLALLPLHDAWPDDEPADLIEWAEALAP